MARHRIRPLIAALEARLPANARAFLAGKGRHLFAVNRRSVSRGVAVGVFFGVVVPLGQIAIAVLVAPLVRANVLVAAIATLVTNPLTLPPLYAVAYLFGKRLLALAGLDAAPGGGAWAALALGVGALAIAGAAAASISVSWWWAQSARRRWAERRARRAAAGADGGASSGPVP